jgi:hypothetical protein
MVDSVDLIGMVPAQIRISLPATRCRKDELPLAIVLSRSLYGSHSERLYTPLNHFGPKLAVRAVMKITQ